MNKSFDTIEAFDVIANNLLYSWSLQLYIDTSSLYLWSLLNSPTTHSSIVSYISMFTITISDCLLFCVVMSWAFMQWPVLQCLVLPSMCWQSICTTNSTNSNRLTLSQTRATQLFGGHLETRAHAWVWLEARSRRSLFGLGSATRSLQSCDLKSKQTN